MSKTSSSADQPLQLLHIGNNNPTRCYQVNDITIHPNQLIRNLGLWMTSDLKWNTHISIKSSASIRRWFNLTRVCRQNQIEVLVLLYKQFVRPIIEFPLIIYNHITPSLIIELERVQKTN